MNATILLHREGSPTRASPSVLLIFLPEQQPVLVQCFLTRCVILCSIKTTCKSSLELEGSIKPHIEFKDFLPWS